METLGDRIRGIRAKKKLSQFELADRLKVHTSTVSRWESSEREPNARDLIALAQALDTSVSHLLGETDDPTPAGGAAMAAHNVTQTGTNNAVNGNNTVMVNQITPDATPTNTMPLWATLPQAVYQVVQNGIPQEIAATLDATRAATRVLEQAAQQAAPA